MGRRTEMDDVERQTETAYGDPEILQKKTEPARQCCFWCLAAAISAVITVCVMVPVEYYRGDAHYSIAIDSTSDLDAMMTTGLSFNLTLGVASHSHGSKACVNPGMYAEVSYHGVQLAASPAESGRLCAEPHKAAEKHIAAVASGMPVGHVMDSLVADMEQHAAVFDVALHIPAGSYGGMASYYGVKWLSMCTGRRVGGGAGPCNSPNQDELYA